MFKPICENTVATAAAAVAGILFTKTPFLRDKPFNVLLVAQGITGAPTVKIQASDDPDTVADGAATWVDLGTWSPAAGGSTKLLSGLLAKRRIRANVTAAGTAGTISAYGDCDP